MALSLNPLRVNLFPLLALVLQPAPAWTLLRPAALLAPVHLPIPSWNSLLELFPSVLWAVPKKKVSHSRKSMRSAHKGLKDKSNIVSCPGCGSAKLAHNLCPKCYSQISRNLKRKARGSEGIEVKTANKESDVRASQSLSYLRFTLS